MNTNDIPLGLYVHMPWCESKCPYCDFNSHRLNPNTDYDGYIAALLEDLTYDIKHYHSMIRQRPIRTIYIGGGTPSLFRPELIQHLLQTIQSLLICSEDIEITLEMNPGSPTTSHFKEAGINRLSIGAQSFHARHLRFYNEHTLRNKQSC